MVNFPLSLILKPQVFSATEHSRKFLPPAGISEGPGLVDLDVCVHIRTALVFFFFFFILMKKAPLFYLPAASTAYVGRV